MEAPGKPGLLASVSRRPEFSFGFRNVLADVVWLEAVQSAGNRKMTRWDYDRLYEQLDVVANFDPKFEIPYLLGGLVLGESTPHARKALHILRRGKEQYPGDWRFPFYMGFTHYFSLGDAVAGGGSMAQAARLPGSPAYLQGLASRMLSEAREPELALALLVPIVRQESDPARRAVLERRIREVARGTGPPETGEGSGNISCENGGRPASIVGSRPCGDPDAHTGGTQRGEIPHGGGGEGAQRPGFAATAGVS